jgi:nucleotide-binding universal stress UspA family protein
MSFVMKPERILLPLDIRECPLEIFSLVERFARRPEVTLTLLHVVHLNILAPDSRVYEELVLEARGYLERLAQQFVHPITSTVVHVRLGETAAQILEEAKAENVELIILATYGPSFWSRLVSIWKPGVSRVVSPLTVRIVRDSTCAVFLSSVKTRFNCEQAWGRMMRKNGRPQDESRRNSPNFKGQEERQFAFSRSNGSI